MFWLLSLVTGLLCASFAHAVPFEIEIEQNADLPIGQKPVQVRALDEDITECRLLFTRDQWKDAEAKLRMRVEYSLDEGRTWWYGECTAEGSEGSAIASTCSVPVQPGKVRHMRGEYEVVRKRFRASATVACG